ncbi:hypothetical protein AS149_37245 [Burkholderia cenocepacia]|nr:hypothetical protein AS149_37245 [Burkholderia cenocepacia]
MPARTHIFHGYLLSALSLGAMFPTGLALMRGNAGSFGIALWNAVGVAGLIAALMLPFLSPFRPADALLDGLFGLFLIAWVSALAKAVSANDDVRGLNCD